MGRNKKHGLSGSRVQRIWNAMIQRCHNPNHKSYIKYGGKGIEVCKSWRDSFVDFVNWANLNGYKDDLTIDRIDNNKGYFPENCRWRSYVQQANNMKSNRNITFNNETHTMSEWSRILKIPKETLRYRLNNWSIEEALTN